MFGEVGILNVGCGDTKIVFDPNNPQDMIRAARIVKDMLRRGYALLVTVPNESDPNGKPIYRRATDFDEKTCEYIIADFDPLASKEKEEYSESTEATNDEEVPATTIPASDTTAAAEVAGKRRKGRRIKATESHSVAVARSAGG